MNGVYQKYGVGLGGMAEGLQTMQTATAKSFKDAIVGIDDLRKGVEDGYKADNTAALQTYLKSNIKAAGLGAEAPDMLNIQEEFGSLFDSDTLNKTITSTREQMATDAIDEASVSAGASFSKSEDLGEAASSFKNKLLSLGMKDTQATAATGKWQQDNKFMAENVANTNSLHIAQFGDAVLDTIKSHGGTATTEEVINNMSADLPAKIRNKAITTAKLLVAEREKLSPEQQADFDHRQKTVTATLTNFDQQQTLKNAAAAAKVAQYDSIQPGIKAAATKMAGEAPDGIMGKIAENAKSWFGGLFGNLDGQEVVQDLQPHVDALIQKYEMPADQAYAIALQSYQEAKADGGQANLGSGASIVPQKLQERVHAHLQTWINQKAAIAEQNNIMATGVAERARLGQAGDDLLHSLKKGESFSNISMNPYDSEAAFKKSIFGASVPAATQPVPGKTVAKPGPETKPAAGPPTMDDLKKKAAANKVQVPTAVGAAKGKKALKSIPGTAAVTTPVQPTDSSWFSRFQAVPEAGAATNKPVTPVKPVEQKKGFIAKLGNFDKETREAQAKKDGGKVDVGALTKASAETAKILRATPEGKKFTITLNGVTVTGRKVNGKPVWDQ